MKNADGRVRERLFQVSYEINDFRSIEWTVEDDTIYVFLAFSAVAVLAFHHVFSE